MDLLTELENALAICKAVDPQTLAAERKLQAKLRPLFEQGIRRVMAEIARSGVPADDVNRAFLSHLVIPDTREYIEAQGDVLHEAVVRATRHQARKLGLRITEPLPRVTDALKQHIFEASEHTLSRMKGDVMEQLAHCYREGFGIDKAADHMRGYFDGMTDYELRRVARTEINGAQGRAAHEALVELGAEYEQWITELDGRERDSHREVHGQITRVGDRFSNGLLYAHDRSGPIEEWIQCRCATPPFIMPEGKMAPPGKQWFTEDELVSILS